VLLVAHGRFGQRLHSLDPPRDGPSDFARRIREHAEHRTRVCACRAKEGEPVGLGLGERQLVRHDDALVRVMQPQRAVHATTPHASLADHELVIVNVDRGSGVLRQRAAPTPCR
jgi:hypothetical protein